MDHSPLKPSPQPPVWWLVWAVITAAFFMAAGILETVRVHVETTSAMALAALVPFAASAVMRFGVLPRANTNKFVVFIIGLALAETGGFIALIFGSPWKTQLLATAIVLMVVHVPAFVRRV